MEVVEEEAKACEQEGRKVSQEVLDKMAYVTCCTCIVLNAHRNAHSREVNLHAMRLGPGKHLQGRVLMNGIVKPEEFDYFHEVRVLSHYSQPVQFHSLT